MSTAIAKNFQVGADGTATNNFTIRQPATPDGTVRIANGNTGSTTDLVTLTSAGNLGIGTSSPGYKLEAYRVDLSGARTSPVDIASVSAASTYSSEAYTGFGAGLVFKSAYYGSSTPVVAARIRNKINDDSVVSFGSSIAFDVTANRGGSLTQAMELNYAGNLGLGVTPSAWSGAPALDIGSWAGIGGVSGTSAVAVTSNAYFNAGWKYKLGYGLKPALYQAVDGVHAWYTAPSGTAGNAITFTQAMTLDSSGNLLVGATGTSSFFDGKLNVYGSGSQPAACFKNDGTGGQFTTSHWNTATSGTRTFTKFVLGSTPTEVGSISSTGTSTTYATSSDYRLKENIAPMTGALAVVQQLKPVTYTWKADGSDGQGFIAHELQEVVPDCVTGEKDAVETYTDEDGVEHTRPVYQGIDTSFLVATLTAAIQELKAINDAQAQTITALTARVEALEAAKV